MNLAVESVRRQYYLYCHEEVNLTNYAVYNGERPVVALVMLTPSKLRVHSCST